MDGGEASQLLDYVGLLAALYDIRVSDRVGVIRAFFHMCEMDAEMSCAMCARRATCPERTPTLRVWRNALAQVEYVHIIE